MAMVSHPVRRCDLASEVDGARQLPAARLTTTKSHATPDPRLIAVAEPPKASYGPQAAARRRGAIVIFAATRVRVPLAAGVDNECARPAFEGTSAVRWHRAFCDTTLLASAKTRSLTRCVAIDADGAPRSAARSGPVRSLWLRAGVI